MSSQHPHFTKILRIFVLGIFLVGCAYAVVFSRAQLHAADANTTVEYKPLYLPDANKVRLVTLGFDHFAATLLWFNTLNYFGKQFAADADYHWLGHMCTLVTTLDPRNQGAVKFCATMLSWVAKQARASTLILHRAIIAEPTSWQYHYLLGFNYWYFHENHQRAKKILTRAAQLPGAPAFVGSLAARLSATHDDPSVAIKLLKDLLERTEDVRAKTELQKRLRLAIVSRDISILRTAHAHFERQTGRKATDWQELVDAQTLTAIPKDPWGETYQYDAHSGKITSKKGKDGLVFRGKTAKTGLARFEQSAK